MLCVHNTCIYSQNCTYLSDSLLCLTYTINDIDRGYQWCSHHSVQVTLHGFRSRKGCTKGRLEDTEKGENQADSIKVFLNEVYLTKHGKKESGIWTKDDASYNRSSSQSTKTKIMVAREAENPTENARTAQQNQDWVDQYISNQHSTGKHQISPRLKITLK